MTVQDIMLERETANDESASLVKIHVASGAAVEKDELLFEIENSKAVQELRASGAGVLQHDLYIGQRVAFGVPIARLVSPQGDGPDPGLDEGTQPNPPAAQVAAPPAAPADDPQPRFSHEAARLIAASGLSPGAFAGDFITSHAVLAQGPAREPSARAPVGLAGGKPVDPHKRAEITRLGGGAAGAGMLSVLGVSLGPMAVARAPGDLFDGRITDLVIYEASRLMRKFPKLNACYEDGRIHLHEQVHAGLAIDGGERLVVYGVENADTLGLPALSDTLADAIARYATHDLTGAEMSRATYIVSDLSHSELDFMLPLLPRGLSCILGVTHTRDSGFRIFAGFDHRVTEGGQVALFLGELRDRLLSFAEPSAVGAAARQCDYCGRSATDVVRRSRDKGLLAIIDERGRQVLCCAGCWNGW